MRTIHRTISSSQIIILGFFILILLGALLLSLPVSARDGQGVPFSDALFTATSAVCVTGLVVRDTATTWSLFGQTVLFLLIQTGGMGVVTVAAAITIISGKRVSLKQRSTMQEALSAHQVGGIVRLTGFIVRMTLLLEMLGAAVMLPVFWQKFGPWRGIWYSLFHSVSAFCNAGFDLMGVEAPFSSLTSLVSQPVINLALMALIIIGGIGFLTWDDVRQHKLHLKKYRMQSKVILTVTCLLTVIPAVWLFFGEFSGLPLSERIWGSLFQSVTLRTAGFNTVDFSQLSEVGQAAMIPLMLIGGSPGSTAGGLKSTTFAVLISTAVSVSLHKEHTAFFGRRISDDTIRNAVTILMIYLFFFLTGGFIISSIEKLPLLTCLFETASAVGTVGISLGVTPQLGQVSRMILILLMYIGRVGGLTLIFSAVGTNQNNTSRLPQEKLTVG